MRSLYTRISKFLAYVLRHHPQRFNIELDAEGYTSLKMIANLVDKRFPDLNIDKNVILKMIAASEKRRFEISGDKIRAFYGHSLNRKIRMQKIEHIPDRLYHGTNACAFRKIEKEGIKRKSRQYVHLSESIETAYSVGKRRTENPIILVIDSKRASKDGIQFYKSGDMYLADFIPPEYISVHADNI
ncbi:MAG: RNA 2'-phosphotransferase [Promethearchaeota archaeon]|nr:MAG: RNA 2'-phosphotransferase [Candidatus Lokiarchaeota archaeon]